MKLAIYGPDGFICYWTVWSWEVLDFLRELASGFQIKSVDLYGLHVVELL